MTAASPARCLPGKWLGLAGAGGKGRPQRNRSNRKQVENLFSIYVLTRRDGEALWCIHLAVASCLPSAEGEGAAVGLHWAWAPCCSRAQNLLSHSLHVKQQAVQSCYLCHRFLFVFKIDLRAPGLLMLG